jgi:hypothetical protein
MPTLLRTAIKYSLFISLFYYGTAFAADATSKSVENAYYAWCNAVGTAKGHSEKMVKFYAANALLLPTLSPEILINDKGGLNAYFTSFTSYPNIKCTTNKLITQMEGDVAINTGLYTFTFSNKDQIKTIAARFTFVYKKSNSDWLIVNHHSSVLP